MYNPDLTPWVHTIYEYLQDREKQGFVFVAAAQIGKSLTSQIYVAWIIDQDPTNILYFADNDVNARYASERRIQVMIDSQTRFTEKVESQDRRQWSAIEFDGGSIYFGGANTASQLASKSAPRLIRDETSKWKGSLGEEAGALELSAQRVKGQSWKHIFDISTPVQKGDPILKRYDESNRLSWLVPCPLCGEYQKLMWDHIRWPKDPNTGKSVAPHIARDKCWYECSACAGQINEHLKPWMIKNGRAIEAECRVNKVESGDWSVDSPLGGHFNYSRTYPEYPNTLGGLHISRLYSPFEPWGQMVYEWLSMDGDRSKLQVFINSALAEPFHQCAVDISEQTILKMVNQSVGHGECPSDTIAVVVGADYHGLNYGIRFVVYAFNPYKGMTLIDYGELFNLDDLAAMYAKTYILKGTGGVSVSLIMVDAGYETVEVFDMARRTPNTLPVFGRSGTQIVEPYSIRDIEKYPDGRRLPLPMKAMMINTEVWKDHIYYQINNNMPKEDGNFSGLQFYNAIGDDFVEAMTSEKRVELTEKTGRIKNQWVVAKHGKNHYWDATVYALVGGTWLVPQIHSYNQRPRPTQKPRQGSGWDL